MAEMLADQVASSPIFDGLADEDRKELVDAATRVEIPAGEAVFLQGEANDAFLVVVAGSIEVSVRGTGGQRRALGTLGSGAVVGETSMLVGGTHSATAYAVDRCVVLRFGAERFQAMLRSGSLPAYRVVLNLARVLATRLRLAQARLAEMSEGPGGSVVAEDDLDRLHRIFFTDWGK
jgi:CRP/FNR family cyclic AMP-dependent transcriptional regulator